MKISMFSRSKGPSEIVLNASFFAIFFGGLRCNSLLSFELSGPAGWHLFEAACSDWPTTIIRSRGEAVGMGGGRVLARRIVGEVSCY